MDLLVDYGSLDAMGSVARQVGDEVGAIARRVEHATVHLESQVGQAALAQEVAALRTAIRETNVRVVAALRTFGDELQQASEDFRAADAALADSAGGPT